MACPWAHRTIIVRKLKRLEGAVGMTVVDPVRDERGWAFREGDGYSTYRVFEALDLLDAKLAMRRYLFGATPLETDWWLFVTLVRFDPAYFGHFKCNLRRIADYPELYGYLRDLYQYGGISETVNFDHIKRHYYYTHDDINPTRIVPIGPLQYLAAPHGRERIGADN